MKKTLQVMMLSLRDAISHPLRTLLAVVSVALSVGALVCMLALTAGIADAIASTFKQSNRLNLLRVTPQAAPQWQAEIAARSPGLTLRDVEELRATLPRENLVSPIFELQEDFAVFSRWNRLQVRGVLPEYFEVTGLKLTSGRPITDADVAAKSQVVVLGHTVKEILKERGWQYNQIRLRGVKFITVGELERVMSEHQRRAEQLGFAARQRQRRMQRNTRGRAWDPFRNLNEQVIVPLTTLMATLGSVNMQDGQNLGPLTRISSIEIYLPDLSQANVLEAQVSQILLGTHLGVQDFAINTPEADKKELDKQVFAARFMGAAIAGTTLLIGLLGIANLMLSALSDRIREIGIMQAVGAGPLDLFVGTLTESVLIAVAGSLAGVVLAFVFMDALVAIAPVSNSPVLMVEDLVLSICCTCLAGLFAGLYPAWKSSHLHPVDALRYE